MISRFLCIALLLTSTLLSGCVTPPVPMAFSANTEPPTKPVFLMTATLKNTHKPRVQPQLHWVEVQKAGAESDKDRTKFLMDKSGANETGRVATGNSYLLRMELEPGSYEVRWLLSGGRTFPFIGTFITPLLSPFQSAEPGIYYLGHVEATLRARNELEFRAGPLTPLIDQGAVGAGDGTFDVTITDEFATDEKLFRAKYPALKEASIKKAILPPFDRAKIQKWYDTGNAY